MSSIKKSFAGLTIAALMLAGFATPAKAQTVAELQALINQLMSQIAAMSGGNASASSCTTFGLPGIMGVQQAVNQLGYAPALMADGANGPKTKAGVMWAQTKLGVSADGAWGAKTNAAYMAWLANCSGGSNPSNPSTPGTLSGNVGTVDLYDNVSKYAGEEVVEGDEDVVVAGLEVEVDDGSDIMVTSIKVEFNLDASANGSEDFDDYAKEVTVWYDGDKVGSVDVEDMSETDDVWSKTIPLDGVVIEADETGEILVAVSAVNNIDSADIGDEWELNISSLRFVDASGAITTDSASSGSLTGFSEVVFTFETLISSGDVELNVARSSDDADARVETVNNTSDTNDVELLAFDLEAEDGSDIWVDELSVIFTTDATNVDGVANRVSLWLDGEEIASESVPASAGTTETIAFEDLDFTVDAGEKAELMVKADINDIEAGSFDEGDTLKAEITGTEVDLIDAEDEEGDALGASALTGSALGEEVAFYVDGIVVTDVEASKERTFTASDNTGTDQGTFVVEFKIKANGSAIFVDKSTEDDNGSNASGQGVVYDITATAGTPTVSSAVFECISNCQSSDDESSAFRIAEGRTETYKLTVILTGDATTDQSVKLFMESINWGTTTGAMTNYYSFDLGEDSDADTGYLFLNDF